MSRILQSIDRYRLSRYRRMWIARLGPLWGSALADTGIGFEEPMSPVGDLNAGGLWLPALGIRLPSPESSWILRKRNELAAIRRRFGVELALEGETLVASWRGVRFGMRTPNEAATFGIVLLEGEYGLSGIEAPSIIDVGANVGFASLYFLATGARAARCYEPFAHNAGRVRDNLALNPEMTGRMEVVQAALADREERLELPFSPDSGDGGGLFGLVQPKKATLETIEVRQATPEVAAGLEALPEPHVLKLDCEGAEYGILRDLEASGLLTRFSAIACEWHEVPGEGGAPAIAAQLGALGYVTFSNSKVDGRNGMVYAVRRSP